MFLCVEGGWGKQDMSSLHQVSVLIPYTTLNGSYLRVAEMYSRVLTRIVKVGVLDSLFVKSRSPSQKVGVPLPQNRSHFFLVFFFFMTLL